MVTIQYQCARDQRILTTDLPTPEVSR